MASSQPVLARVFAVPQSALALVLTAITGAILALTWNARGSSKFAGLAIGACLFGALALAAIIGATGLWKGLKWAWWLTLIGNVAGLAIFAWEAINTRVPPDPEEIAFIVSFAVLVGLGLLPAMRRYFLQADKKSRAAAGD